MSDGGILNEARRRRADLRAALAALEQALAAPARGREAAWMEALMKELKELDESLDVHVLTTEQEGGLFEEVMEQAPRLAHAVDRLRSDHDALHTHITALESSIASVSDIEGIRSSGLELIVELMAHRHRGADLVFEAYNVDIEAAD